MPLPRSGFAEQFYTNEPQPRIRKRHRYLAAIGGSFLALGLLANGCDKALGEAGTPTPKKTVAEGLKQHSLDVLKRMSARDQYEVMYIGPMVVEKHFARTGGTRTRGQADLYKVRLGQTCLSDNGYNTQPSKIRT